MPEPGPRGAGAGGADAPSANSPRDGGPHLATIGADRRVVAAQGGSPALDLPFTG
jgi:hypothetical protein